MNFTKSANDVFAFPGVTQAYKFLLQFGLAPVDDDKQVGFYTEGGDSGNCACVYENSGGYFLRFMDRKYKPIDVELYPSGMSWVVWKTTHLLVDTEGNILARIVFSPGVSVYVHVRGVEYRRTILGDRRSTISDSRGFAEEKVLRMVPLKKLVLEP